MAKRKKNIKKKFPFQTMFGILIGVALGSVVTIAFFMHKNSNQKISPSKASISKVTRNELDDSKNKVETTKFEFYSELTKPQTVEPSNSSLAKKAEKEPKAVQTNKDSSKSAIIYQIQAGIYDNHTYADSVKAKLNLNGLDAKLETINTNHKRRFRVTIGPFTSRQVAENTQRQLNNLIQTNGALVIKHTN